MTVARNRAVDLIRSGGRHPVAASPVENLPDDRQPGVTPLRGEIEDDLLRMLFVACHPALSLESQLADALGVPIERLDLRVPSLERLRLSAGIAATRAAIGGASDRAVLIGSSLGGLTAARVAALDARACALVLLAPAFRVAERWRSRLGEEQYQRWRETGWLEVDDFATGQRARIDFGFAEDMSAVDGADGGWPDVRVPTLIIHGRFDEVVAVELSRAFAAGKRHVRLVEVDDSHELTATLPRTLATVEDFLEPFLGPSLRP